MQPSQTRIQQSGSLWNYGGWMTLLQYLNHRLEWLRRNKLSNTIAEQEMILYTIERINDYGSQYQQMTTIEQYQNRINNIETQGKSKVRKNSIKWHIFNAQQETLKQVIFDLEKK